MLLPFCRITGSHFLVILGHHLLHSSTTCWFDVAGRLSIDAVVCAPAVV
jgi:hypothetical protein